MGQSKRQLYRKGASEALKAIGVLWPHLSERFRSVSGRKARSSKSDDSDETADVDELTEPEIGLAVGNARSNDCMKLEDCGDDGGGENDLSDGGNVVNSGELKDCTSGLGV